MKRILLFITLVLSIIGCKEQQDDFIGDGERDLISSLRADFENQPGYKGSGKHFLMEEFRSDINWSKIVIKGIDTTYIKVNVLDSVQFGAGNQLIDIGNYVWIRAVRGIDEKINYTLLIFVPEAQNKIFNGLILKKKIGSKDLDVSFISESRRISKAAYFGKASSSITRAGAKNQNVRASGSGGCVTGYVNGIPRVTRCPPDQFDPGEGMPDGGEQDYGGATDGWYDIYPVHDGGGGTEGTAPAPSKEDKEIIDALDGYPCAQAVLAKLPNLENKISTWLNSVFNKNIDNHLIFRVSANIDSNVDGFWHSNNEIGTTQTISLNGEMLSKASQEYIAATFFHEALHGFLDSEEKRLKKEGKGSQFGILYPGWSSTDIFGRNSYVIEHSTMASTLQDLANAIKTFNPSMSNSDALALAKAGIVSNMPQTEKDLNLKHRKGNAGTKCN